MIAGIKKRKSGRISLRSRHSLYGYFFTAPFALGFIFFFLTPFLLYVSMSFSDIRMSNEGLILDFAGLEYYKIILTESTDYISGVLSSLVQIVSTLPAVIIYSFFIASVLNKKFKGRLFFRAAFFLPVIIASGVQTLSKTDGMAQNAISAISGVGNTSGDTLNLAGYILNFLGSDYINIVNQYIQPVINNIYSVTMSSGVQILVFLAAIQTIPPSIYEAANIDGATAWESFWKITFPYLSPMIVVNAVYTLVDLLGSLNNDVVASVYDLAESQTRYSLSASMGLFYFAIVFALIGLMIFILSKTIKNVER